jgi:ATP dependent DNA ligase domain
MSDDRDAITFPKAETIPSFAMVFMDMMFAHAELGSIPLTLRPTVYDRHVLTFDEAGFAQASSECLHEMRGILRRPGAQIPDRRQLLLRARRERPRGRRAAKQRDELAAPDASCHLIPPAGRSAAPNDSTVRSGAPQGPEGLSVSAPEPYLARMLQRTLPAGFIAPCLPTKTDKLPSSSQWLHEIKHDGFRIIARKDGDRVRLYSRPGNDMTRRFPLIVDALARLRSRSCIIDGEAVACDENGVASFDLVRHHRANDSVFLYAFDLIELNGDDLRRDPLQVRKATLASILAEA